jgi:hypothetical protein
MHRAADSVNPIARDLKKHVQYKDRDIKTERHKDIKTERQRDIKT